MKQWNAVCTGLVIAACSALAGAAQLSAPAKALSPNYITVAPGTTLSFIFLRAEMAATAVAGDTLYMQVNYPVTVGDQVAIPAGSFLLGTIQTVTKPIKKSSHAHVTVQFAKLILPSGHTILMHEAQTLDVQVSTANDVLIDNGTQADIVLSESLRVDAVRVAASLPLAQPVKAGSLHSATRCVPQDGTPGTPGTPGTASITIPGNPPTVIPGTDGGPPTVFPGTPDVVVPGTAGDPGDPGTPAVVCPNPPLVVGSVPAAS